MDEAGFQRFLKKGGRSQSAIDRCLATVKQFERYLQEQRSRRGLDEAAPEDLEEFVAWVEREPKTSAKAHLWAIRYYYEYASNDEMQNLAGMLREQRIARAPLALKEFRGVHPGHVERLAAIGVKSTEQMLEAGGPRVGDRSYRRRRGSLLRPFGNWSSYRT